VYVLEMSPKFRQRVRSDNKTWENRGIEKNAQVLLSFLALFGILAYFKYVR